MANYVYIRVSTEEQSFDRQFKLIGDKLNGAPVEKIVTEKMTTKSDFRDREIYNLMTEAAPGSTIYVASLDRIGRSMSDLLNIFDFADERKISFFDVKLGMQLEKRTPTGKLFIGIMSAMAEVERETIRTRTKEGLAAIRAEIAATGRHLSKRSGQYITKLGPGTQDLTNFLAAASKTSRRRSQEWLAKSPAYKRCCELYRKGYTASQIAEDLSNLYDLQPDVFCTFKGGRPNRCRVNWWIREYLGTPYRACASADKERENSGNGEKCSLG